MSLQMVDVDGDGCGMIQSVGCCFLQKSHSNRLARAKQASKVQRIISHVWNLYMRLYWIPTLSKLKSLQSFANRGKLRHFSVNIRKRFRYDTDDDCSFLLKSIISGNNLRIILGDKEAPNPLCFIQDFAWDEVHSLLLQQMLIIPCII